MPAVPSPNTAAAAKPRPPWRNLSARAVRSPWKNEAILASVSSVPGGEPGSALPTMFSARNATPQAAPMRPIVHVRTHTSLVKALFQHLERCLGLLERRDHVHARDLLACLAIQLPRQCEALGGRVRAPPLAPLLNPLPHHD